MLARPLRELGEDELGRYAYKAVTTMGTADDLAYFLPRLLDLLSAGELDADPEIVLAKLEFVYDNPPATRRAAVDALLLAAIARELRDPRGDPDAWICGVALGTTDAAARLAELLPEPEAREGLRRWAVDQGGVRSLDDLQNGYWGEEDAGAHVLIGWFGRADVRGALGLDPLPPDPRPRGFLAEERC
jgi:hypothetical protein